MRTIAGKEMFVTVAFRIPFSAYERALQIADRDGHKHLSKVLRPACVAGLDAVENKTTEVKKDGKGS